MSEGRVTRVGKVLWLVLIRGVYIVVEVIKMVLSYGSIGSLGDRLDIRETVDIRECVFQTFKLKNGSFSIF